jgi:hypothetical protein
MGTSDELERKLPELETNLEALVANSETDEKHLAVNGMKFLKQEISQAKPEAASRYSPDIRSLAVAGARNSATTGPDGVGPRRFLETAQTFAISK